ncbi:hypothetical protein CDAR_548151 [Caerostris darwini]|uniref:Uncharacterized protein n=1 Tax=Caerostris darwini TaxID=1538125 RepID=A0AAV4WE91_9ARAC|nr:hypothetical protein CDAR_548151 [Caerostris darwini]
MYRGATVSKSLKFPEHSWWTEVSRTLVVDRSFQNTRGGQKFPEVSLSLPSNPAHDLISLLNGVGMMNRPPHISPEFLHPHSGGRWIL